MKKYKTAAVILLFFVFQIVVSFLYQHKFEDQVGLAINHAEQQMKEDGVPPEQRQGVTAALRDIRLYTSSYVQGQTLQLLTLNALTLIVLFGRGGKDSRADGEA